MVSYDRPFLVLRRENEKVLLCISCHASLFCWGFINKEGVSIGKCNYKQVRNFSNDMASVMTDQNLWGYVNLMGDLCIDAKYSIALPFDSNGRAWVSEDGENFNLIKKDGTVLCTYQPLQSEDDDPFPSHDICYVVRKNQHLGVVDINGKELYAPEWDRVLFANDHFIYLEKDGTICYGDYLGNIVIPKD